MILHPSLNAVAERLAAVNKALGSGRLSEVDTAVLKEGYGFPYQDHAGNNTIAIGRGGAADLSGLPATNLSGDAPGVSGLGAKPDCIPFTVSVLQEDRDGDVVVPLGCQLGNFARSPGVFFGHQQWEVPIGTSRAPDGRITVFPEENRIRADWYPDYPDPDADFIAGKVMRGVLSGASIAFVPIEAYRRDRALEKGMYSEAAHTHSKPDTPAGWYFKVYDLTEWSIVGVPSNAGAIRDALDSEKSFITPRCQKAMSAYAAVARGCWNGWCPCPPCDDPLKRKGAKAVPLNVKKGLDEDEAAAKIKAQQSRLPHVQAGMFQCAKCQKRFYTEAMAKACHGNIHTLRGKVPTKSSSSGKSCGCKDCQEHRPCPCKGKVEKYIRHEGSQWVVHAESGKVLGKHPTKEQAEAQLRAVEANKHKSITKAKYTREQLEAMDVRQIRALAEKEGYGKIDVSGKSAIITWFLMAQAGRNTGSRYAKQTQADSELSGGPRPKQDEQAKAPDSVNTHPDKWVVESFRYGQWEYESSHGSKEEAAQAARQVGRARNGRTRVRPPLGQKALQPPTRTRPELGPGNIASHVGPGDSVAARTYLYDGKGDLLARTGEPLDVVQVHSDGFVTVRNRQGGQGKVGPGKVRLKMVVKGSMADLIRDERELLKLEEQPRTSTYAANRRLLINRINTSRQQQGLPPWSGEPYKPKYGKQALTSASGTAGGYTVPVDANTASPTVADTATLCPECGGAGNCPGCGGEGMAEGTVCPLCGGSGACQGCAGAGQTKAVRKAMFKVHDEVVSTKDGREGTIAQVRQGGSVYLVWWKGSNGRYDAPDSKKEEVTQLDITRKKSHKGNNMATRKRAPARRKQVEEEEDKDLEGDSHTEEDADQPEDNPPEEDIEAAGDRGESPDEAEQKAEPPRYAKAMAHAYNHAKSESDWLDGELGDAEAAHKDLGYDDVPPPHEAMAKYKAKHVDGRIEHLKEAFAKHHPEHDIEEVAKGLEQSAGGGDTDFGEEGAVQAGRVPPDSVKGRYQKKWEVGQEVTLTDSVSLPGGSRFPAGHRGKVVNINGAGDAARPVVVFEGKNGPEKIVVDPKKLSGGTGPSGGGGDKGNYFSTCDRNSSGQCKSAPGSEEWAEEEMTEPEHKAEEGFMGGDDAGADMEKGMCPCGFQSDDPSFNFCPGCGEQLQKAETGGMEGDMHTSEDADQSPFSKAEADGTHDQATEEILERYQSRGKWYVKSLGRLRRTKSGRAFLVRAKQHDEPAEDERRLDGEMGVQAACMKDSNGNWRCNHCGATNGPSIAYCHKCGNQATGMEQKGMDEDDENLKAIGDAGGFLKDLADEEEIPKGWRHAAGGHAKMLGQVHKALTNAGKVQRDGGSGSTLTDEGTAGNKGSMKDQGETQANSTPSGKSDPVEEAGGHTIPKQVADSFAKLQKVFKLRTGIDPATLSNGSN